MKFKESFKYIFIFLFSFLAMSFFLTYFDGDVLWNYGFSYALSKGEIPYLDFNMILTPLYPMIMSLILKINTNILLFYLENAFLITVIFYFLFKMVKEKAWLFLVFLVFPIPAVVFPSYNLFLLFLAILLIYCEEEKKSDYLIGLLLGFSILTKQTVGVFLVAPSLIYYHKDLKKIMKRIIGLLIPNFFFLLYLLVTESFKAFCDLCIFGLFDFSSSNKGSFDLALLIGIMLIIVTVVLYFKNKKNIRYLYVLFFSSIMIPLFDYPHIEYFFFLFLLLVIEKIKVSKKNLIGNVSLFSLVFLFIFFYFTTFQGNIHYPNHYNNFNFRLLYDKNGENIVRDKMIKYLNENKDKKIVFLASDAYFYKITCNLEINYFDLINKGNHGFNGTEKMKEKLSSLEKKTIIIVDTNETFSKRSNVSIQFNRELAKYGIKLGKKIKKIGGYTIYEKL